MRESPGEPGKGRAGKRHRTGAKRTSEVGRSGARFPSAKVLEHYEDHYEDPEEDAEDCETEPEPERPDVGRSGARFPSAKVLERYAEPEEEPEPEPPAPRPSPEPRTFAPDFVLVDDGPDHGEEPRTRVRPYVLTRGRTRGARELAIETLVSVRPGARWEGAARHTEYQPVRVICAHPRSVAEVAAGLCVPLGVARVLLSDLAELELVHIHESATAADGRPPMVLMQRVLDGLRRL
ncbi:DUF742 domain-containing protein [Amycolatopsis anabasis]|uniref:DUF742 domain-containing protein n=1 Tax=Amycolatopsis anabasis TaxID=1840409 RepID=UPI00131D47C1|nr:DUF742 domain-containing protein [Amycolatopsis anabasis]